MVQKTIEAELDLPFEICYELTAENRDETFQDVCGAINERDPTDTQGLTHCLTNEGFCQACCTSHVGANFMNKRTTCLKSCTEAVKALP